jgi:hypothetical protein
MRVNSLCCPTTISKLRVRITLHGVCHAPARRQHNTAHLAAQRAQRRLQVHAGAGGGLQQRLQPLLLAGTLAAGAGLLLPPLLLLLLLLLLPARIACEGMSNARKERQAQRVLSSTDRCVCRCGD